MTRPAKLQINQRGAWRDVMTVDIDQLADEAGFLEGAAAMVRHSGNMERTTMRIVSADDPLVRLMGWRADSGWVKVGTP